jgi:diguanylate cyclase (GGDEF)-like protein
MCDIDHFKYFNDTYGHTIGDDILRLIASVIKKLVKDRDIAARYGGEEFAVVMPNARLPDAIALAEQIRTSVMGRDINIRSTGKSLGRVTISIGAAQLRDTSTRPNAPAGTRWWRRAERRRARPARLYRFSSRNFFLPAAVVDLVSDQIRTLLANGGQRHGYQWS